MLEMLCCGRATHDSALPRHEVPELLRNRRPSKAEGAGNAGCTPHPLPRVQTKKTHAGQHRYAEITPALPAPWFYGLLRALPGVPGFLAPVANGSSPFA